MSQFDLYAVVTDQIVAMLEKGVVPWRNPILGRATGGFPRNIAAKTPYRGVNVFLLAFTAYAQGYSSSCWLTFRQAKEMGGSVKKGEKSTMVVFWKQLERENPQTHEKERLPLLRYYNVFNVEQCEGITAPDVQPFTPNDFTPVEQAEHIAELYEGGPSIEHGGTQAFYRPSEDLVKIPEPTRFSSGEQYYSTLFHELAHSTGHGSRLDRKIETPKPFGSLDYGKEELVAEMAAAFLSAHAGIQPAVIENQASYLQGWLKRIKEDKKLVIMAAGQAQRAADWILGTRWSEREGKGNASEDLSAPETVEAGTTSRDNGSPV
jgi:antirestriction protein ArdC